MIDHSNDELILNHYKRIAGAFGDSHRSTMEDDFIRESEVQFITSEIDRYLESNITDPKIYDLGCGNGFLLTVLREKYSKAEISGMDFTPELVEIGKSRNIKDCEIVLGDARKSLELKTEQDVIISERSIINIMNRDDQHAAFGNISKNLKSGGLYIQIESYKEPLDQLNQARREVGVAPDIEPSVQNKYLTEAVANILEKKHQLKEIEGIMPKNFLSSHFYITRVFHKMMVPEGSKQKHDHFTRFFTQALPDSIGNYSPILFRVFKKI